MLDFNHTTSFMEAVNHRIDTALETEERASKSRSYLGGSRLGVACQRALQFEYTKAPKDEGREFSGQLLRIFAAGHLFEDLAIKWLRMAGFTLFTAINKDTAEIYHELVPFDGSLAQKMSDKGVRIIQATEAGELLPRISRESTHFECKMCSYADRCWRLPA